METCFQLWIVFTSLRVAKQTIGHIGNVDSYRAKGDERMFTRTAVPFILSVAVVMFGGLACNSNNTDEARDLALSRALVQVKLFSQLTDVEMDALKVVATLRRGRSGERIIEQGKALDRMFIILKGQAEVWVNGEHVVTLSGQPLVGEIEFLTLHTASADVILVKETDLIELNYAALTHLMENQPRIGYILMREIAGIEAQRLRDTNPK